MLGNNPIVRVVTDQGISGYGEVEAYKPYLKPHVLYYKQYILGEDPTDVERVMLQDPPARRVQALGQRGQRDRDGAVGHRRQGRGRAGLQAAGRQGARPGARLQRRASASR